MTKYLVTITTTEDMLGSAPADPEIYRSFIATKKHKDDRAKATAAQLAEMDADEKKITEEELKLLPAEDKGITVFRRNAGGLILTDFMIRGFLKEAAEAVSGIWGVRSKIDKWLFVKERQIPVMRNGAQLKDSEGINERPLRAMTMQGPRVALAASEVVKAGATMTFTILVFPLGESKGKLDEETISSWLEYGAYNGLGQWRTGSNGRFTYELKKVE